jgi:hypothetical protein
LWAPSSEFLSAAFSTAEQGGNRLFKVNEMSIRFSDESGRKSLCVTISDSTKVCHFVLILLLTQRIYFR